MAFRYINIIFSVVLCLLHVSMSHAAQEKDNIEDLFYKNSLFHYYGGDYISALTKTLINSERQNSTVLETRNKLLLGGIYLAYGLDYDAKSIFDNLKDNDLDEETKNIIWFYLGRDFYENFDYENSEASLENITPTFTKKHTEDKINLLSNVYVYNNKLNKLNNLLLNNKLPENTVNYIKFNLGVGYLRNDDNDKGRQYLSDVGNIKPLNLEQSSIRDKAKLHLAMLAFKQKDYKSTITYAQDINANGIFSENAIYLSALAHSISGNSKKAFSLLSNLKGRKSNNVYKYYSLLLISRILEKNKSYKEALSMLKNGVDAIQSEKKELDGLLAQINDDFFLVDIGRDKSGEIVTTKEKYRDLIGRLVFNREFSGLYSHYVDLLKLQKTINHWGNQIPEFYIMLKERDIYFKEKKKTIATTKYHAMKKEYKNKVQHVESIFNKVEKNSNVKGLFTEDESDYNDDFIHLSKKITRLSNNSEISNHSEKLRIMKGLNYWGAATQYHPRLWQAKTDLKETKNEISILDKRISSLEKAARSEFNYTVHKRNVDLLYSRLHKLNKKLSNTTVRLKMQLIRLAAEELDQRFKNIDSYYRAFKFDVARVSDRIVLDENDDRN